MELRGCFSLFVLIVITILCYKCNVLAGQDLFYEVDGSEVLMPIFENDAPKDFCVQPPTPSNGEMACGKLRSDPSRYVCIGRCEAGFEFPNKEKKGKITCSLTTGRWMPSIEFPDCEKEKSCIPPCRNGGTCLDKNICSCAPRFEGDRCQIAICNPTCRNGGTCQKGNECVCAPNFEGNRCEFAACNPPCRNGGTCGTGNECVCAPNFEGDRCEYEKLPEGCANGWTQYYNTDNPTYSDIGDDESLDRIREFQPVCPGGVIEDIECKAIVGGKLVDYKERDMAGLKCSKDVGFTCNSTIRRKKCEDFAVRFLCECDVCIIPPKPANAKMVCSKYITDPNRYSCVAECEDGYNFPNGQTKSRLNCDLRTKQWISENEFPDCRALCDPPCQNGGTCSKGNKCTCTENFEGDRCDIEKFSPVCENGWTPYFNTDDPRYSAIGDDESLERIRRKHRHAVCPGGIIKDIECLAVINGQFVDYNEVDTFGSKCSKQIGFICNKALRLKECDDFAVRFYCECAVCNPPCQNGGSCDAGNKCICPSDFEGDRCENAKLPQVCVDGWTEFLNTDFPEYSAVGDDESLDRLREFQPVCTGGVIKDVDCKAIVDGTLVDYKERGTVGLKCSNDTGFTCDAGARGVCEDFTVRFLCECVTGVTTTEGSYSLLSQICPEVPPHILNQCPPSCPPDFACFEYACVPRENCPCYRNNTSLTPKGSVWQTENCEKCECKSGGNSVCEPIKCLGCLPDEIAVLDSRCHCKCVKCPETALFCPEKGECLEIGLLCNGRVNCPGLHVECATVPPMPELPPATNPMNCSTDQQSETDTCEITGNMLKTFDGHTYQYDTCSHVLMKEQIFESFSVTVHKICSSKIPVNCYRHLIINVDGLIITFGPGIDSVTVKNTKVPLRSLWLVSQRFSNIELKENGNTLVFRSLKYNFDVTWDRLDNSKIKVSKCLINRIAGLCGFYNRKYNDDMKMSNGILTHSAQEFGSSWAIGSLETCLQSNYTFEISNKANVTCTKLSKKPFNSCYEWSDLNRKVQACFSFMRECMQRSVKAGTRSLDESEYEKCKCLAFESFSEDCEIFKNQNGPAEEWRILHDCVSTCPHGMEWHDCGPGCQLTCDNYHQRLKICTPDCVPGCYCPAGLVRHQNQCVKPKMCQDCICRGHGDPNYITFDGHYYAFQGTCTYILAQHVKSTDKTMNFKILGTNSECPEEPKASCIHSIRIFWNDIVILLRKSQPVSLDRKTITSDQLPYDKGGISVTYVPNKHTLIHIKRINLVVRYFDQINGFTIELPSFYFYNETEGLCGVCNFNASDDLYHKNGYVTNNTEDFAYSWLVALKRRYCSLERLHVAGPPPGICNFTGGPCEAILDPSPFLKSCENDVRYSERPEISVCRSKFQYAHQCCERGVPLDEWLKHSGCDGSCSAGMEYKCTSTCPKTCENYKTYREDDCPFMPQNMCVCPEGEVLKLGKCVKSTACEVCDKQGHGVGDVWQLDTCKTCECLVDLTTKCTVHQCLEPPVCSKEETLLKVEGRNDTCCDSYKCVSKSELRNCAEPKLKACPPGKALVMKQTRRCPIYQCECFPQLCPPNVTPHLDDGESVRLVTKDCCPEVEIKCDRNLCARPPNCSEGFKLSEERGRCCLKYKCVPQENVCVYQHHYEVVNGTQRKLPLEKYYDKEYQPGSLWYDGLCRECICIAIKGRLMSRCKLETCQSLLDFPDSEKYIRAEVHIPGSCCPKYVRKLCVDQGVNYKIGDQWSSTENNLCRKISRCVFGSTGEAFIDVTSQCETPCTM